jgi:ATP-dependent DNA helicase Q4
MACYCGTKVTVLVNVATAGKLQAFSHSCGIDHHIVNKFLQALFWNRNNYRNVDEFTGLSLSEFDLNHEAFEGFVIELIREGLLVCIPFHFRIVSIRIHNMVEDMKGSKLMNTVLQKMVNRRGQYVIPILELCHRLQISPLEIDVELQRYGTKKWIEFSYSEEFDFFRIKRKIENDDQFAEMVGKLAKRMANHEEKLNHSFDVMFTLMKNMTEMDQILETGEPEVLIPIPRTGICISDIKRLLTVYKHAEWTPCAVARIFHGIGSPKFDVNEWMRTPFWGSQGMTSFNDIMKFCQQVMCNPGRISNGEIGD